MKQILFVLVFGGADDVVRCRSGADQVSRRRVIKGPHPWAAWCRGYFDREGLDVELC